MKFHELTVGRRFEFAGEAYRKTSLVLASHEQSGNSKFMARSAPVTPLDKAAMPAKKPGEVPRDSVLAAFEAYHRRCGELLEGLGLEREGLESLRQGLAQARRCFLESL